MLLEHSPANKQVAATCAWQPGWTVDHDGVVYDGDAPIGKIQRVKLDTTHTALRRSYSGKVQYNSAPVHWEDVDVDNGCPELKAALQ